VFLPGLLVGRLFDLGYFRSIFLTCSATIVIASLLIAECKEYWHFVLCQGILVGVRRFGFAFSVRPQAHPPNFFPFFALARMWRSFRPDSSNHLPLVQEEKGPGYGARRNGFFDWWYSPANCREQPHAAGGVSLRYCLLGLNVSLPTVLPFFVFQVQVDDANLCVDPLLCSRSCELGTLPAYLARKYGLTGCPSKLLRRRLPPRRVEGGLFNLVAFKSAAYSTYCLSAFICFLGVYTGKYRVPGPRLSSKCSSWQFSPTSLFPLWTRVSPHL